MDWVLIASGTIQRWTTTCQAEDPRRPTGPHWTAIACLRQHGLMLSFSRALLDGFSLCLLRGKRDNESWHPCKTAEPHSPRWLWRQWLSSPNPVVVSLERPVSTQYGN
ncbi:MAG: hypothetical protein ACRYGR_10740 [Janthinobacterium lividum]